MNQTNIDRAEAESDPDLAEQAKPGHGVPSQDPDPTAQFPIGRDRAMEEQKTAFAGAGVVAGAVAGAAVGTAVAGPVGVLVGASVGAVAGALGGAAAGSLTEKSKEPSPTTS